MWKNLKDLDENRRYFKCMWKNLKDLDENRRYFKGMWKNVKDLVIKNFKKSLRQLFKKK